MKSNIEYICHTRYEGPDCNGAHVLIRRGDKLQRPEHSYFLYFKDQLVCVWRSLVAKQHFAINDDSFGMERGELTRRLAYSPRGDGCARFSLAEQNLLREKYPHLLKEGQDVILFNDRFFELPIEELAQLEEDLMNVYTTGGI